MVELDFVQYDDNVHRDQYYELTLEYITWVGNEVKTRYDININPNQDGTAKEYLDSIFNKFTEIKPPEGIIYLLLDEKRVVGMGALRKLEEGIGEIKRMYIKPDPSYRGNGYGQKIVDKLVEKARLLGFSTLRLDTGAYMPAAVHIYKKAGFKESEYYSGNEFEQDHAEGIAIYMEKKL